MGGLARSRGCSRSILVALCYVALFQRPSMVLPKSQGTLLAVTALPAHKRHISELAGIRSLWCF